MEKISIRNSNTICKKVGDLEYLQFPNLKKYEEIAVHCFTTRKGGVSTGEFSTLNMGLNKNDLRENVEENYRRICSSLNIDKKNMVFSKQVHDNKIKIVGESDKGKEILPENGINGYDGLATNVREIALVTFYADCVPVFLLDPVKKAIASVHSGWKGTVKEIAAVALKVFVEQFKSNASDIEIAIGPSIGGCCFEVGKDVYGEFVEKLPWSADFIKKTSSCKWHINLQEIIKNTLVRDGADEDKVFVSGICTKCNNETFFSYRGDKGSTGSLAAIIQLL